MSKSTAGRKPRRATRRRSQVKRSPKPKRAFSPKATQRSVAVRLQKYGTLNPAWIGKIKRGDATLAQLQAGRDARAASPLTTLEGEA